MAPVSASAANANITNPGTLIFYADTTAASATITNTGTLTFVESSTAASATISGSGATSFEDNSTAGNAVITSTGSVIFKENATGGNAAVLLAGAGTLDISQLMTAGTTLGSVGGASGQIALGSKNLQVGGNNLSTLFSGQITDGGLGGGGGGSLTKVGTGTLTLTNPNNIYTGPTIVNAGALFVEGSLLSEVTVNAATLGGSGAIGGLIANGGATLTPGSAPNAINTLTVNGTATIAGGTTYLVDINAVGQSDLISASGTATINGGTVTVFAAPGSYQTTTKYKIIQAGGRNGMFDALTIGGGLNPAFAMLQFDYTDPNAVFITLTYTANGFVSIAQTPNQKAVATTLSAIGMNAPFIQNFTGLSDDQIRLGLDTMSGEIHATLRGTLTQTPSDFLNTIRDRVAAAFDGFEGDLPSRPFALAPLVPDRLRDLMPDLLLGTRGAPDVPGGAAAMNFAPRADQRVWLSVSGKRGDTDGDGNAAGMEARALGVYGGMDIPVMPGLRLGLAGGWSRLDADVPGRFSTARTNAWHVGATAAAAFGEFRLRGALAYSGHDINTNRTLVIGKPVATATADYTAHRLEAQAEAGFALRSRDSVIEPYVGLGVSWLRVGGFTEAGAGVGNLVAGAQTSTTPYSLLGARHTTSWTLGDLVVAQRVDLAWRHAFGTEEATREVAFVGSPNIPWTVAGPIVGRDSLMIAATLDSNITEQIALSLRYRGLFARANENHAAGAAVTLRF